MFLQQQDLLPRGDLAPGVGPRPGVHPVLVHRRPAGLPAHHLPRPVPLQAAHQVSGEVLQDLPR